MAPRSRRGSIAVVSDLSDLTNLPDNISGSENSEFRKLYEEPIIRKFLETQHRFLLDRPPTGSSRPASSAGPNTRSAAKKGKTRAVPRYEEIEEVEEEVDEEEDRIEDDAEDDVDEEALSEEAQANREMARAAIVKYIKASEATLKADLDMRLALFRIARGEERQESGDEGGDDEVWEEDEVEVVAGPSNHRAQGKAKAQVAHVKGKGKVKAAPAKKTPVKKSAKAKGKEKETQAGISLENFAQELDRWF